MSQLHAELTEQAHELGFEDIGEAEQAGYGVDWEKQKLINPQEMAHREWVKEKEEVLKDLETLQSEIFVTDDLTIEERMDIVNRTINFIKKGEV